MKCNEEIEKSLSYFNFNNRQSKFESSESLFYAPTDYIRNQKIKSKCIPTMYLQ